MLRDWLLGVPTDLIISPVLTNLHWLPVHKYTEFKVMLLIFKILPGEAQVYLHDLIRWYSPRHTLRSENQGLVENKSSHTVYYDNRNFITAALNFGILYRLHCQI